MARFGQAPKASKPPQQLSKALEPHNPPQQLSKACRLLRHGTSLGPTSCFCWASKLLCGTFSAGSKSLKTSAPAFAGVRTSHPSAAAFEGVPLAWPWYLPRPHKLFLLGFETAMRHVLGRPQKIPKASKPPQQLSQALEPHTPPQQLSKACRLLGHGTSLGPTSCFYWASKLLCGTFWARPKSLKTSAAAFDGLRTSQPSAAAFEGVPLAWPWYLPRPHKLCLFGLRNCYVARFEAPKASKPPQQLSQALEPHTPPQHLSKACRLPMVPPQAPQAVSIGLRNCYVARFGQAPKASKPPQQLSQALEPHTPPQQLSKASRLLGHGTPQAVSIGLRNCYVARFGQAPKAPKPPQQLSQALEPHNPPQQLSKASRLLGHGFETAMWHVLGRPWKPQNPRSSFRRP